MMLLEAVVLKFVPVMVTEVPIGPEVGEKEEMVGTWAAATCARRTATILAKLVIVFMASPFET